MRGTGARPPQRGLAIVVLAAMAIAAPCVAAGGPTERKDATGLHKIHVIDFEGEIEPALAAYTLRRIAAAKEDGVDGIVFRIDSPGGRVDSSTEVAQAILGLPASIRAIAWVPDHAYSGASMAALACDEIVMGPGARIGDCQPILIGEDGIKPVGEKIETVLRAEFRRFAEENGWPKLLAEKMVSKDLEVVEVREATGQGRSFFVNGDEFASARPDDLVEGVHKEDLVRVRVAVPKDRLLTLTAAEAKSFGFVRRTFAKEAELLAAISAPGASVVQVSMSVSERASRWLLGIVGILGALVTLCLMLTLFQGVGIATAVGVVALLLVTLVTVTADLAQGFSLLLIGVGILLLAAEALIVPGFGFVGIAGIVTAATGFLFLSTGASLSSPGALTWDRTGSFILQFAVTILVAGGFLLFLSRLFPSLPFARRHLLLSAGALGAGAAVLATDHPPAVGALGAAQTALRPAGRAAVDGKAFDVTSEGGFVEAGTPVRVVRVEGTRVVVRPEPAPGAAGAAS